MSLSPWRKIADEQLVDMGIFTLHRVRVRNPRTEADRDMARVSTQDWVNVVAIDEAGELVLVRQYRHGTDSITLEIPGGLIDAGESPRNAALRELLEETGHSGGEVHELGFVLPNPAFIDNRCFSFLVLGCRRTHELALDDGEDIEVVTRPASTIPQLVESGEIRHALVICAFWFLTQHHPDQIARSR